MIVEVSQSTVTLAVKKQLKSTASFTQKKRKRKAKETQKIMFK